MQKEKRANIIDGDLKRAQDRLDAAREKYGKILQRGQELQKLVDDWWQQHKEKELAAQEAWHEYCRLGKSGEPVPNPYTNWQRGECPLPEAQELKALMGYGGMTADLKEKWGSDLSLSAARSFWADLGEQMWSTQSRWERNQDQIDFEYCLDECTELEKKIANLFCREEGYAVALDVLKELKAYQGGKAK